MTASSTSAMRWLTFGAFLGVVIAAGSLVQGGAPPLVPSASVAAPGTVALVNDVPIPREALARFAASVAQERGRLELDAAEQRRLLSRLIDEELLLQRGIALGLDRREPSARRAILSALIDSLTAAEAREPKREELEIFLRDNRAGFTRPGRVTIEAARVPLELPSSAEAPARAAEVARRAQAGESLASIAAEIAAPIEPPLPPGPIALDVLRDRVGGIVVQAVAKLEPGATSAPVRAMDGYWVVRLVAREPDVTPPLEEVWEPVKEAWSQREHERQLVAAIAALRDAAHIEILDPELRPE